MAVTSTLRAATSVRAASLSSSCAHRFIASRSAQAAARSASVADVPHAETLEFQGSPAAAQAVLKPTLLQPRVVVYDGVCHLCHRGVKRVIRADKHRKIKFCCVQSKAAEPYLEGCGLGREDVLRRFLFVEGPGAYHVGSSAALKVMSYLPLPYSALSALLIVPTPLRDAVYDHIAKKRYDWFGKEDECLVLREQDLLHRFIDRDEILDRSQTVL